MGDETTVTLQQIQEAFDVVKESSLCVRTPLLRQVQKCFHEGPPLELYLKLENTQKTGSFKVRGLSNQLRNLPSSITKDGRELVTMSAGNYGKAFSIACHDMGLKATVVSPDNAGVDRIKLMESYGTRVVLVPKSELKPCVDQYVEKEGMYFLHPFDDLHIIAGHGSCGLEILEDLPDPDVVVVCCGGGGLVAGVAAAIKLSGMENTRIYCCEPETANVMYRSFEQGSAASLPTSCSVASGLAPPYAGKFTYHHCKLFTEGVILVSEKEIIAATKRLYYSGLVVEPSGAAAYAALMHNKIPDVEGKKVVIVLTGGNIVPEKMVEIF